MVTVCSAVLVWTASWGTGLSFFVLESLLILQSLRRSHFVDVGRFTAGVFPTGGNCDYPALFAVAFTRYEPAPRGKRCGLQVIVGRVSFMACALLPRDEWAEHLQEKAAREARRAERDQ